jgi:hypothetical protein
MKNKYPEIITIVLIIFVFLFPPWMNPVSINPLIYNTQWEFLWASDSISSIDTKLLCLELVAVGGIYYLLKKINRQ